MGENNSVFELITLLCNQLSSEYGEIDENSRKRLRIEAYETLLTKSRERLLNPIKEITYYVFEKRIRAQNDWDHKKCDELEEKLEEFQDVTDDSTEAAVLNFLLALRETGTDEQIRHKESFFPINLAPIGLTANPYILKPSRTDFFKLDELCKKMTVAKRPKFFSLQSDTNSEDTDIGTSAEEMSVDESTTSIASSSMSIQTFDGLNWEHLGSTQIPIEPAFISEVNSIHRLPVTRSRHSHLPTSELRITSLNDFLRDLKHLAIGIESEIFTYNELKHEFNMLPGITIDTLTSDTLHEFIAPVLECGTCFRRIQILIKPHRNQFLNSNLKGFVFSALCTSVDKYLAVIRKFIWSFHDVTICQFKMRITKVTNEMVSLAKILGVHPECGGLDVALPLGSEFLTFLYDNITHVTKKDVLMLFMYILRNCCDVYYKYFEKWIFCGALEDPENELFIEHVDKYKPNTKQYFDKAFLVVKKAVPGFLNGYEDDILLSGKYTMLLRAYKPDHSFFGLQTPKLRVCVSETDIEALAEECRVFLQKALAVCGPALSFNDLFQEQYNKKLEFQRKVEHNFKENLKQWRQEQETRIAAENKIKQKQLRELQEQIEQIKEQKLAVKMAEIEMDKYYIDQAIQLEDRQIAKEMAGTRKRIEYYEELNQLVEERKAQAESEVERLKNEVMAMSTTSDQFSTPDDGVFQLSVELSSDETKKSPVESVDNNLNLNIPQMKHSASDHFNANVDTEEKDTTTKLADEFNRNKKRILGSNQITWGNDDGDECHASPVDDNLNPLTDMQRNRLKGLSHVFGIDIIVTEDKEKVKPTEMAANRQKVLNVSEDVVAPSIRPISADLDRNRKKMMSTSEFDESHVNIIKLPAPGELTDLQKNRNKVMSVEYNRPESLTEFSPSRTNLNLDLDRVKNRKKVLESEYNIITGDLTTPTSTTSDLTPARDCDVHDAPIILQEVHEHKKFGVPDTAIMNENTPASALNTAGAVSRDGFKFPTPKNVPSQELPINNYPIERPKRKPFKFFPMLMDTQDDDDDNTSDETTNQRKSFDEFSNVKIITFTKRLQMSLVMPLQTQLEILNNEIFKIFLRDLKILNHFRSLRHFYFLMDGEFGSNICDGLISRLEKGVKPNELLNYQTLHMILENALSSSVSCDDKNADRLSFMVNNIPEKFELTSSDVFGNLSLSYQVKWPLNLIINNEVLDHYATIFRYLIKVRRMSWILEECFNHLKTIVKVQGAALGMSPQYLFIHNFRHKLTHFIMTLQNHITSNALQATWKKFKDQLANTHTIEDLYHSHIAYIKHILFLCMLNRSSDKYYKAIEGIFKITIKFYRRLTTGKWRKCGNDLNFTHSKFDKLAQDAKEFDSSVKYIVHLGQKCAATGYQSEVAEFINLININGYYNRA